MMLNRRKKRTRLILIIALAALMAGAAVWLILANKGAGASVPASAGAGETQGDGGAQPGASALPEGTDASGAASGAAAVVSAPTRSLYEAVLNIDPASATLSGSVRLTYVNTSSDVLNFVELNLYPNSINSGCMKLSSVAVDDSVSYYSLDASGTVLTVPLIKDLVPGGSVRVFIAFSEAVPQNAGRFGVNTNGLMLGSALPLAAVYSGGVWSAGTASSEGLPYLSDVSDYRVLVTSPAEGYGLAYSGELIDESSAGGVTSTYIAAPGARDFALALVSLPSAAERAASGNAPAVKALVPNKYNAAFAADTASAALGYYVSLIGTCPYKSVMVVPYDADASAAYPGLIMVSDKALFAEQYAVGKLLIARAAAGEWFGCAVGSDMSGAPWLSDALCEYLAFRYVGDTDGEQARSALFASRYPAFASYTRADPIDSPLSAFTASSYPIEVRAYGVTLYSSLETLTGDDAFSAAIASYYSGNTMKLADASALIGAFSTAYGSDLSGWFSDNR